MWRFLKKLEIELPYDPAIPLLGIHTKETRIERDMCTPMFIAALFTIAMLFFSVPAARTQSPWRFRLPALTIPPGLNFFFFFAPQPALVSEVAQSCLTLCDPMYCSPPGSSVHGILQARILE